MKTGIFSLQESDRDALTSHFLRLSATDRRLRFNVSMPDEPLAAWCRHLPLAHTYGYFYFGDLVAVIFIAPESAECSEFAVSVDQAYRGHGLARQLLDFAAASGPESLVIRHAAENTAMARVHQGYPSRRTRAGGEVDVEIDLLELQDEELAAYGLVCGEED